MVTRSFLRIVFAILYIQFSLFSTVYANDKSGKKNADKKSTPLSLSGIYPHLAYYNNEGECGTGAVVPWNESLWVITYGPHLPQGSSDKLYRITSDLKLEIRKESIGGTPANRMIHKESNQLFIGPYVVDGNGNVRVVHHTVMPGRLTGNARHLTDPKNKIYYGTMEEGFYEVDVHSLDVKTLYKDGNFIKDKAGKKPGYGPQNTLLPGVHGKGLYSGQGVMLFTNNGEGSKEALEKFDVEAGVLAEWNGKDWKVVRRNQFTEVTGPGGICGNENPETDPLWALGWDHKSVLLGARDVKEGWSFYRLPKASNSYDGAHGWNTEWPRIRNVGTEDKKDYLMTMHGMFWRFPGDFSIHQTAGIRPRSAYLKVIGDFARWQNRLVFGCDDSAKAEFLNKRKAKGNIAGPGQSNSNLWFTSSDTPDKLGPATANGAVWIKEKVVAGTYSEPFLFAGWNQRVCWLKNDGNEAVSFTFEVDKNGNNQWSEISQIDVPAGSSTLVEFASKEKGEWIRVKTDKNTVATASFNYTAKDKRSKEAASIFKGLATVGQDDMMGGLLYSLGNNRRALGVISQSFEDGEFQENGYYEMSDSFKLVRKEDSKSASYMKKKLAIPTQVVTVEKGSVLVIDGLKRRWRLPLGSEEYTSLKGQRSLRICREVATERDLFSCHGTFYELPAENADGYAKMRPIASHSFKIHDYASYRGLLVMTGIEPEKAKGNEHIIVSDDKKAAIWAGAIDDLWKMGKPVGKGGPWVETSVKANELSDPYLIGHYDRKELLISHDNDQTVNFVAEVDATGNGDYMRYKTFSVAPGEMLRYVFPKNFHGRWIRFSADKDTQATTWLNYK